MKRKKLHVAFTLALIVLTVGFIWINSALSGEDSSELSGKVRDIMEKVLVFLHAPQGLTEFLLLNVRKVAHFVEYAAIGAELAGLLERVFVGFGDIGFRRDHSALRDGSRTADNRRPFRHRRRRIGNTYCILSGNYYRRYKKIEEIARRKTEQV